MKTKGLIIYVYKNNLGDCSNFGMSSKFEKLILVGDGIPEIFEGTEENSVKISHKNVSGEKYTYLEPITKNPGQWNMFGGNFGYCSDSRFPAKYPLPIHDRFE